MVKAVDLSEKVTFPWDVKKSDSFYSLANVRKECFSYNLSHNNVFQKRQRKGET